MIDEYQVEYDYKKENCFQLVYKTILARIDEYTDIISVIDQSNAELKISAAISQELAADNIKNDIKKLEEIAENNNRFLEDFSQQKKGFINEIEKIFAQIEAEKSKKDELVYIQRRKEAEERAREKKPIETTAELSDLIKYAIPPAAREGGHHPAKRSFQAIRIEVNAELDVIEPAIRAAVARLSRGGRVAIITFHSLEDRIVKQTFASLAQGCTCPKDFPVCVCGKKPKVKVVSRKPILPSAEELEVNPRSRSAKLRVAEKI